PPPLSSLFYHSYAHHRDLHSFPTRRSSDLDVRHRCLVVPIDCNVSARVAGQADRLQVQTIGVAGPAVGPQQHIRLDPATGRKVQDRKSTRLNSSHVKISYAVFCLKKKKKKE